MRRPSNVGTLDPGMAQEWESRHVSPIAKLLVQPAGSICSMEITPLDISASKIRSLISAEHSPRYLMPETVMHFIQALHLYTTFEKQPAAID